MGSICWKPARVDVVPTVNRYELNAPVTIIAIEYKRNSPRFIVVLNFIYGRDKDIPKPFNRDFISRLTILRDLETLFWGHYLEFSLEPLSFEVEAFENKPWGQIVTCGGHKVNNCN